MRGGCWQADAARAGAAVLDEGARLRHNTWPQSQWRGARTEGVPGTPAALGVSARPRELMSGPYLRIPPPPNTGVRRDRCHRTQGRLPHPVQRQAAPGRPRSCTARPATCAASCRPSWSTSRTARTRRTGSASEDKVERAALDEHKLQFSYKAGDDYHFMNTESYEMVELSQGSARRQRRLPDRGHDDHGRRTSRAAWSASSCRCSWS